MIASFISRVFVSRNVSKKTESIAFDMEKVRAKEYNNPFYKTACLGFNQYYNSAVAPQTEMY